MSRRGIGALAFVSGLFVPPRQRPEFVPDGGRPAEPGAPVTITRVPFQDDVMAPR